MSEITVDDQGHINGYRLLGRGPAIQYQTDLLSPTAGTYRAGLDEGNFNLFRIDPKTHEVLSTEKIGNLQDTPLHTRFLETEQELKQSIPDPYFRNLVLEQIRRIALETGAIPNVEVSGTLKTPRPINFLTASLKASYQTSALIRGTNDNLTLDVNPLDRSIVTTKIQGNFASTFFQSKDGGTGAVRTGTLVGFTENKFGGTDLARTTSGLKVEFGTRTPAGESQSVFLTGAGAFKLTGNTSAILRFGTTRNDAKQTIIFELDGRTRDVLLAGAVVGGFAAAASLVFPTPGEEPVTVPVGLTAAEKFLRGIEWVLRRRAFGY